MIRNARPNKNERFVLRAKEVQMVADGNYLQLRCAQCRKDHSILSVECQRADKCLR